MKKSAEPSQSKREFEGKITLLKNGSFTSEAELLAPFSRLCSKQAPLIREVKEAARSTEQERVKVWDPVGRAMSELLQTAEFDEVWHVAIKEVGAKSVGIVAGGTVEFGESFEGLVGALAGVGAGGLRVYSLESIGCSINVDQGAKTCTGLFVANVAPHELGFQWFIKPDVSLGAGVNLVIPTNFWGDPQGCLLLADLDEEAGVSLDVGRSWTKRLL